MHRDKLYSSVWMQVGGERLKKIENVECYNSPSFAGEAPLNYMTSCW